MKQVFIIILLSLLSVQVQAQVYGNGTRATQTRSFEDLSKILININGKVNIICGAEEAKMEISYDENILDFVSTEMTNGLLEIGQKKWIEGSQEVEINIYTPELDLLFNDSWSKIRVTNIQQEKLIVKSTISTIELEGAVETLDIYSEKSTINAYNLKTKKAKVEIEKDGMVYLNASEELSVKNKEDGKVKNKGAAINSNAETVSAEKIEKKRIDTRFINLKVKNNSMRTLHTYVKGPKPDGNYFSYGLPFGPMKTRSEYWSIGTKLYKVGLLGKKTLIYEVKEEDEGQIVKLN